MAKKKMPPPFMKKGDKAPMKMEGKCPECGGTMKDGKCVKCGYKMKAKK